MNWLLPALTNTLSKKLQKALCKEWMLVLKDRDIFSICCTYTLFVTCLGPMKKLKLKQYKLFTIYGFFKVHPVSVLSKW
jgi:hypothetical protein